VETAVPDHPTWKLAGPDCDPGAGKTQCAASDGAITLKTGPTAHETDNPKVGRHHQIMAKYGRGLKVDDLTLAGQAVAEVMEETLRRAGRNLTRESLTRAAESIKNWNEGLAPNVTMGPDDHAPLEDMKVVEVRNGKFARELTGWITGAGRSGSASRRGMAVGRATREPNARREGVNHNRLAGRQVEAAGALERTVPPMSTSGDT
jgi:hypothetical protein